MRLTKRKLNQAHLNPVENTLPKVVIYRRLSKKKQHGNQYGFDAQEADIEWYLTTFLKQGYQIVGEFQEYFSAGDYWDKRPEMVKAVDLCKKHNATLVVAKLDRLGRDVESIAHLIKHIDIKVAAHPNADRLTLHMLAVAAEEELQGIRRRVKAGLAQAKKQGKKLGRVAGTKIFRDGMLDAIRSIQKARLYEPQLRYLRDKKALTWEKVAEEMNAMGFTTQRGQTWTKANARKYYEKLSTEKYEGVLTEWKYLREVREVVRKENPLYKKGA